MSKRAAEMFFGYEKYQDKAWYCFDPTKMKYASPRDRAGFLRGATSEEEREAVVPPISPGFFRSFHFKHLCKYVDGSGGCTKGCRAPQNLNISPLYINA